MSNLLIKWFQNSYGKENIDLNTYGKSTGHSGSYSTNYQQTGRGLLMADEVRMLDNDKAILLIRGEKPVIDFKYDILKHPNVKYTADGDGKMYEHGEVTRATGEIKELTEINKNMKLSIDIKPMPIEKAIREAEKRRLGVEKNISDWQRRQNESNNFSAVIPYDLESQREASKEMLNDLTNRNQKK